MASYPPERCYTVHHRSERFLGVRRKCDGLHLQWPLSMIHGLWIDHEDVRIPVRLRLLGADGRGLGEIFENDAGPAVGPGRPAFGAFVLRLARLVRQHHAEAPLRIGDDPATRTDMFILHGIFFGLIVAFVAGMVWYGGSSFGAAMVFGSPMLAFWLWGLWRMLVDLRPRTFTPDGLPRDFALRWSTPTLPQ